MEIPFIFRGNPNKRDSNLAEVREAIAEMHEDGRVRVEGELEKTDVQRKQIAFANRILKNALDYHEVPFEPIPEDAVHFLPAEVFNKKFSEHTGEIGFSIADERAIFINLEPEFTEAAETPLRVFSTLVHENIHTASKLKMLANEETGDISAYRSGYRMSEGGTHAFIGLNEGVVSLLEAELISHNKEEIGEFFNMSPEAVEKTAYSSYPMNIGLVLHLADKIASLRGETPEDSLTRLVKEQFTGNLMHLRDIEKIYGPGSFKLLYRFGSEQDGDLDILILTFFSKETAEERESVLQEIAAHDAAKARGG